MEDKYCWWPNLCNLHKGEYRCCKFCADNKKCEYPCSDDLKTCKYRCDIPGDQAFKRLREKELAEFYASQNKTEKKQVVTSNLHKISELSSAVKQNYDFIYNKVKSGEIKGVQVGARYFIEEKEFNRAIAKYKGD